MPEARDTRETIVATSARRGRWVKPVVFLCLAAAVGVTWWLLRDEFTAQRVLAEKQRLDELLAARPVVMHGGAFLLYVAVTGLSLPLATVLTLLYASIFGFWPTVLMVSFASTAGATIAFLVSRYLLRDSVQAAFGRQLARINAELARDGALYLLTLRLTPLFPFFIVNLVLGLSPIRVGTFWWASQVGMLPGTCLYAYAGATIDIERLAEEGASALFTWPVIVALLLLGIAPLVLKKAADALRRRQLIE